MQYGEIVQLGRHKLMCGDATSREDVMRLVDGESVNLVLTDPPYGINVVDAHTHNIGGHHASKMTGGKIVKAREYALVIGDNTKEMAREHYHIARTICNRQIIWGGQNFTEFLPPSCGWLFWDKCRAEGLSFSDGELAWCNVNVKVKKYIHKWDGFTRAGNPEWNMKIHPNQKPVELHMRILEDFTQPDDIILDCFGGSGTTLIACEMTGRKCLMMEISPDYCDIISERYNKLAEGKLPLVAMNDNAGGR